MSAVADTPSQSVLITGVSSGIGLGMARKFLEQGFRVYGSVRSAEKGNELSRSLGQQFTPLVFDICNPDELARADEVLRGALPDGRLAALINNAGSATMGPLLHVAPEDLQEHLDTLVVGQLRVIQQFFKYLKAARNPSPRIINISSISGVGSNTFYGCYTAAKHALEGLSKTLRDEVRQYGVDVVVVAPGNIATDLWPKQRLESIERYGGTDYRAGLKQKMEWISAHAVRDAMSVEEFANELYRIFAEPHPANRYTIIKAKRAGWPLSRLKVRVIAG
jgi:NAD(P)-dependent dehydrogenase (short-subunit alcohol dehydrogenase family)